ncbi:hypothetical protein ACO2Q0_01305 [Phenylobacterium sp. VNQ135]|uniref:hypothetical protein n=1 Tax=Phenylobacterium sp. VNQ135 TaxID=3400922 RepID=UPI003C118E29
MAGFSPTDAALEGFRITKERPRKLLAAAIFMFLVSVLQVFIEVSMPDEARAALAALGSEDTLATGALLEALAILSPLLLLGLLIQSMMAAAIYRILLRGQTGSIRLFRVGPAEFRLMALALIYVVLFALLMAAITVVGFVLAAVASGLGEGVLVLVSFLCWVGAVALVIVLGVRLSLAPVITFDRDKLALFDSWNVTRGQFWRLTGAYVLMIALVILAFVVTILLFLPAAGIAVVITGGSFGEIFQIFAVPDEPTLAAYFQPLRVAYMVVSSLFSAFWYAVIAAPGAYAYRALTHGQA